MKACLLICISSFQGIAQIQFEKVLPSALQITADFFGVSESSIVFADVNGDNDQDVLITGSSSQIGIIPKLYRKISVPLSSIENLKADQVRIYPNPFTQASTVELPAGASAHQLRLLNVQGKEVFRRENITQTTIQISHSALSSGLYLLEVQDEWGIQGKKLIRR